ncbi:hypothetical protein [Maribacter ulvicola]|uniref:Cytochrome c domain-containing protein n=1 Tax=Maribacter ulvicola TaxID=228959 RepID=A0A1N6QX39_9FLAO|nr:hypothetical protein [Maribacter ulvicola]SIQ21127.1 hypothetical protein SAMN05421797_1011055 [Maribacter ulvicola]
MTLNYKFLTIFGIVLVALSVISFTSKKSYESISRIEVVDIEKEGFGLLENIQGQWLGINSVAGMEFNWFAWDYRPISSAHVHGIFEGGSMGNLFTSFFIADFKGTKTIMARNGGVLNGIYRTSYFILDKTVEDEEEQYYRLVDAVGGKNTMYMELRFKSDSLYWNTYTSQLGHKKMPTRHMTYKGKKHSDSLAKITAEKFEFPKKEIVYEFPTGFDDSYLYMEKSATFLWQTDSNTNVLEMAKSALDPVTIKDYPYISSLDIELERNKKIKDEQVLLYVSTKSLTNEQGKLSNDVKDYNDNILFSILSNGEENFKYTYVHPGNYFVTAIVDMDKNFVISPEDIAGKSVAVMVEPNSEALVRINDIVHKNSAFIFQNLGDDFYKEDRIIEEKEEEIPVIDWTVTYNSDVKQIIHNNCVTCHGGPSPSARLDLTSLSKLKEAMKHKDLIKRINDKNDPMPPKEMLSLKERLLVFKWMKDGLLKE